MMDVAVMTRALRPAKLLSNRRHQQTNTLLLYRPDAFPGAQPTVSEQRVKAEKN